MFEALVGLTLVVAGLSVALWRARAEASRARRSLRDIVEGMPEGFVLWDAKDRLVAWSGSMGEVYGMTGPGLTRGLPFEDLVRRGVSLGEYPAAAGREEAFVAEMVERHRRTGTTEAELDGDRWIRIRERRTPSGGTVGLRSEITDLKRALADAARARGEVEHLAHHDPLTGLPNRRLFLKSLGRELRNPGSPVAVLYVDLDGFKPVNDRWGHKLGDDLLRAVAARLTRALPEGVLAARIGGDEFAILLAAGVAGAASELAERIVSVVAHPFEIAGCCATIGASVGVAAALPGEGVDALLHRADEELYAAKRAGGGTVRVAISAELAAA